MLIVGIDPGKDGGYCELTPQGLILRIMPLDEGLERLVNRHCWDPEALHVWVEKAQVMVKEGGERPSSVAMFNYGTGFGEILGILRALKMRHTLVRPADWTRLIHQGCAATDVPKARSFEAGRRLFPEQNWLIGNRRKPCDGLCEAALIAEYGRRQLNLAS